METSDPSAPIVLPVKRRRGVPLTPERAREIRLAAIAAKKERDAKAEADAKTIAADIASNGKELASRRVQMLSEQIQRTHDVLKGELEPKERAQLLTALDRLMERERVLRGIPNPGSYRPIKPRGSTEPTDAEPV